MRPVAQAARARRTALGNTLSLRLPPLKAQQARAPLFVRRRAAGWRPGGDYAELPTGPCSLRQSRGVEGGGKRARPTALKGREARAAHRPGPAPRSGCARGACRRGPGGGGEGRRRGARDTELALPPRARGSPPPPHKNVGGRKN